MEELDNKLDLDEINSDIKVDEIKNELNAQQLHDVHSRNSYNQPESPIINYECDIENEDGVALGWEWVLHASQGPFIG